MDVLRLDVLIVGNAVVISSSLKCGCDGLGSRRLGTGYVR